MPHNYTYICLDCRFSSHSLIKCPTCKNSLLSVGYRLKVPKKRNTRQWRKLQLIFKDIEERQELYLERNLWNMDSLASVKQMIKDFKHNYDYVNFKPDEAIVKSYIQRNPTRRRIYVK